MNGEAETTRHRRIDWTSAVMALVALLALAWAGWLRFGPQPISEPPPVGSLAPPLSVTDPETHESVVLVARPGRILWVSFWSPTGRTGPTEAAELDRIWRRFRSRPPFAMVAASLDPGPTDRWRTALAETSPDLPVFLTSDASRRAYGVANSPLHVLIDDEGRIVAMARGGGENLEALARQAERLLDEIDPPGRRFAGRRNDGRARALAIAWGEGQRRDGT